MYIIREDQADQEEIMDEEEKRRPLELDEKYTPGEMGAMLAIAGIIFYLAVKIVL